MLRSRISATFGRIYLMNHVTSLWPRALSTTFVHTTGFIRKYLFSGARGECSSSSFATEVKKSSGLPRTDQQRVQSVERPASHKKKSTGSILTGCWFSDLVVPKGFTQFFLCNVNFKVVCCSKLSYDTRIPFTLQYIDWQLNARLLA